MLNPHSVPGAVAAEMLAGRIIPLLNDEILEEYVQVLARPKFRFDRSAVGILMDAIIKRGIPVDAGPVDELLPDPKDLVFYQVVMERRKTGDAYLVTGNTKHFPVKPFVVTPREMLEILDSEDAAF